MLRYFKKLPNPLGFVSKRLEKWAYSLATNYISSTAQNFNEHPELVAAMLKKPFRMLVDDFIAHPPAGVGNIQGIQSTGNTLVDIGQALLPMFGAKGKKLAQGLAFLPLLQNKGEGNASTKNPFDR